MRQPEITKLGRTGEQAEGELPAWVGFRMSRLGGCVTTLTDMRAGVRVENLWKEDGDGDGRAAEHAGAGGVRGD